MVTEQFHREEGDFFYFMNMIGVDFQMVYKFMVDLYMPVLLPEGFQGGFLKVAFGFYIEDGVHDGVKVGKNGTLMTPMLYIFNNFLSEDA